MKLTKPERDKLKQLIIDSLLNRFTTQETIAYIENALKVKLSVRYVQQARQWLIRDMQKEFVKLREDKYAYIHEYFQRINELKDLQRQGRMILARATEKKDDNLRLKCISELQALTLSLTNLYDLLPAITERFYIPPASYQPIKLHKPDSDIHKNIDDDTHIV